MFDFPVITFALIAVTCVVSFQGFKSRDFEGRFVFMPEAILAWKQYYRLVTSAFLHANPQHLIFNMLSLYLFGVCLWLAYGLLIHAQAVIVTNLATAILIAIATGLKAWTARRDEIKNDLSGNASTNAVAQRS